MGSARSELYIGLMSGTSLDGVDGVLMALQGPAPWTTLAHAHRPFPLELKQALLALNTAGANELHEAAMAAQQLARLYAEVVHAVCAQANILPSEIRALGAHGQTVRHRPELGYTLQLNAPAVLAELTGVDVVADFRSRDVSAGGQGAPLVPAFHQALFERPAQTVVVLNIGGMANLSILKAGAPPLGFDCGPGNALMDAWCERCTGQPFDRDGAWGATGQVQSAALNAALAGEAFFQLPPPKSTGRDLFNADWLEHWLQSAGLQHAPRQDIQATLCELTAQSAAQAVKAFAPAASLVVVCGGGALNGALMRRLQAKLPDVLIEPSDAHGLPVMQVEAAAFAWLAQRHVHRLSGNVPQVTGAKGPRVLGALYPA
ncbi:MAG: anhydro-N-acetylmuramic acid kinase [Rubrivivax sp.]|nr:MAG: anhydro-N-acetylmuramic acid kinase [Rubrivivax sp.]